MGKELKSQQTDNQKRKGSASQERLSIRTKMRVFSEALSTALKLAKARVPSSFLSHCTWFDPRARWPGGE